MSTRQSPYNQPTVPVLDKYGQPLAPAKPSRVRRWLESGRATKVWHQDIFAVQLHDMDAADAILPPMALNIDPGETAGIAITRETSDGQHRAIVGAYEHQHRNRDIRNLLADRRRYRRTRRGRLRCRPARFNNRPEQLNHRQFHSTPMRVSPWLRFSCTGGKFRQMAHRKCPRCQSPAPE